MLELTIMSHYYDIYHKSNDNTDKYKKNQRAAAVVLIKIYFYDYITWFSEPCTVCNNCNSGVRLPLASIKIVL